MSILKGIIKGVAAVAPSVVNYVLPGSGKLVHNLMRKVTGDGPETPIEEVAQKFQDNPDLYLKLQQVAAEKETELARIGVEQVKAVNATMIAEGKSDKWPQYTWRPFNGFMFGICVFVTYFVLPISDKAVPDVPVMVWVMWGSILGVTAWDRGKEKRAKAGETGKGLIVNAIDAIKR